MKNYKKILALGCSVLVVASSLAGCAVADASNTANSNEIEVIQETLDEMEKVADFVSHSDTAGKEETVYAILDADGNLQKTIVSEWLKNPNGSSTLSDSSELSNIEVVKGNAEYSKDGSDNQILWTNDGSDIYYQGNSDKKLPVDVSISYELDGKKVSADELAGASGHLKMVFNYKNNVWKEATIKGEKTIVYQPFVMVSGMLLDNSKVQNITIDNGSAVNSGDNTVVFGIAMPGLKESLGIEELNDIVIPETVTVEADVTDFSLMMTLTIASNKALSQLGFDEIESIDDLKADMDALCQGMNDIIDGATKLDDGVGELATGVHTIVENNKALNTGTAQITDGLSALNQSLNNEESNQMMTALVSGSADFSQGLSEVSNGMTQIVDGYSYSDGNLANLVAGLTQYAEGLAATGDPTNMAYAGYIQTMIETYKGLYNHVATVQAGELKLVDAYQNIHAGIETTADSIQTVAQAVEQLSNGAKSVKEGVASYTAGVSQASDGIKTLENGTASLKDGVIQFNGEGIQKLANIINNDLETFYERVKVLQEYAEEYTSYAGCEEGIECSVKFIYKTDSIVSSN